jgi:hypothetical protein
MKNTMRYATHSRNRGESSDPCQQFEFDVMSQLAGRSVKELFELARTAVEAKILEKHHARLAKLTWGLPAPC